MLSHNGFTYMFTFELKGFKTKRESWPSDFDNVPTSDSVGRDT